MASDIFARIGDIKGESNDVAHKDEIEVLSFSWGLSQSGSAAPGSGAGAGAGKATFQDLSFVHRIDKASPLLMKACATGTHIKDATISHRKAGAGQKDYLIVKLEEVRVTSVSHAGTNTQVELASENVSLSFGKVDLEYKVQKPDGSFEGSTVFRFDRKTNKPF